MPIAKLSQMLYLTVALLWLSGCFALTDTEETAVPIREAENESGLFEQSLNKNGLERDYLIYIPESAQGQTAVPLLLNFHGFTGTANSQLNYADFRPIADDAGFILVSPQGTRLEGEDTHWNVGGWTLSSTTDDVAFVHMLLDQLIANHHIDTSRIYATGHSNGGYMSFLLACQMSERITAVASMAGWLHDTPNDGQL